ncbi:MAG: GNAT family N-acetyltransferase [Candidatus Delongbacteria bacterium]|nr:GNAT family N-acetyltransferase [Candidatus Delongbacteria bacterium]
MKLYLNEPDQSADQMEVRLPDNPMSAELREAILKDLLPAIQSAGEDFIYYTLWLMISKSTRCIVGSFCFHGVPDCDGRVEIGYGTEPEYRRLGLMKEALGVIMSWIRNQQRIRMVTAETEPGNTGSIRTLMRCGFTNWQSNENSLVMKYEFSESGLSST